MEKERSLESQIPHYDPVELVQLCESHCCESCFVRRELLGEERVARHVTGLFCSSQSCFLLQYIEPSVTKLLRHTCLPKAREREESSFPGLMLVYSFHTLARVVYSSLELERVQFLIK
jgi:hypothetical protein